MSENNGYSPTEHNNHDAGLNKSGGVNGEENKEITNEAPPPVKKKGARLFWNIFLIVIIAAGIASMFGIVGEINNGTGSSLGEAVRAASGGWFAVLIAVILGVMLCDTAKYCIISKTVTGRFRLITSVKTNFLGKYYDAVTPFSTGGQPMQIYYLSTKGVRGGNATAMVLIRYYSSILCWILLGGAFMISGAANGVLSGVSGGSVLRVTGWIGIGINLVIPAFITLFLAFPKIMKKLTLGFVKFGHKLKIVKDVQRAADRAERTVEDFKYSFKLMATSPLKLILLVAVSFTEAFLTFSLPYFAMKALSCPVDGMLITVIALNAFATFGVSFVPTPGNSGVAESMGALAFSVAAGASLVWAVLLWRLAVFYVYILIGLGISVSDVIAKNAQKK